jgi:hypothetical protein
MALLDVQALKAWVQEETSNPGKFDANKKILRAFVVRTRQLGAHAASLTGHFLVCERRKPTGLEQIHVLPLPY